MKDTLRRKYIEAMMKANELELQLMIAKKEAEKAKAEYLAYYEENQEDAANEQ